MLTKKIEALTAAKAAVAELEQSIAAELPVELAGLPARFGFGDAAAFIAAVRTASRGRPSQSRKNAFHNARRKRARITDDTRTQVRALAEAGKTGAEIASRLGISLPSVQKIKKALGLVKPR